MDAGLRNVSTADAPSIPKGRETTHVAAYCRSARGRSPKRRKEGLSFSETAFKGAWVLHSAPVLDDGQMNTGGRELADGTQDLESRGKLDQMYMYYAYLTLSTYLPVGKVPGQLITRGVKRRAKSARSGERVPKLVGSTNQNENIRELS